MDLSGDRAYGRSNTSEVVPDCWVVSLSLVARGAPASLIASRQDYEVSSFHRITSVTPFKSIELCRRGDRLARVQNE